MASSRIFVKGLPPTFDEVQFRKHFGQKGQVTDAKIFPNRRIGYVGFKTSEDAQKAVKYFNKTFVRMSRIGVEIARPIDESPASRRNPKAKVTGANEQPLAENNRLKRKRDSDGKNKEDAFKEDPKLKEFLDSYKSKSDKKALEAGAMTQTMVVAEGDETPVVVEAGASDDEYEQVPKKTKRSTSSSKTAHQAPLPDAPVEVVVAKPFSSNEQQPDVGKKPAMTDDEWARSRTSRLLGLFDEEEDEVTPAKRDDSDSETEVTQPTTRPETRQPTPLQEPASSIPTPPAEEEDEDETVDKDIEAVRSTMRLFVRNLPYDVKYEDLEAEFTPFGNLEQVSLYLFSSPCVT